MANEVVLGELGWWTMKGRRDFLRLNYWGKIVGAMSHKRLVYQVYRESRSRYDGIRAAYKGNEETMRIANNLMA